MRSSNAVTTTNESTRALHALFGEEWETRLRERPAWASSIGDRRRNRAWDDVSLAAHARQNQQALGFRARLRAIDREKLSESERLSYEVFDHELSEQIDGFTFRMWLLPINQREGVQTADQLADELPFDRTADYEDWNARLAAFGTHVDQVIELLREGARVGITHPKIVMQRIPPQLDKQIVSDPAASPFYAPYRNIARAVSEGDRERLARAAREQIEKIVVPAFRRLKLVFEGEYLPKCKDDIAAASWPNGKETYAFLARLHTTTTLTPSEIHETGTREVARIRGEMNAIMGRLGFKGSLAEFFAFLRTDPRFYCKTPEELLQTYAAVAKRIDPRLVKLFRTLPRTPYGVEAIPAVAAPDTTVAYYREPAADGSRAGTYFVNLYKPEVRPKWEMMALTLHEAVPGHHLQIALAMEREDMPKFRRHAEYNAYLEGWALYAESLGDEMGLYDDPYSKFGQLAYEMWRAVRLVVDTGMHAFGWERKRAIEYFMANAPKQELDIVNEVDRYIMWPGQALGYKVGELRIKELRRRAKEALGDKLDVRELHEVILEAGALPLDVLERRVDRWIASRAKR